MRIPAFIAALALLAPVSTHAQQQGSLQGSPQSFPQASPLVAPYTIALGDVVASTLSELLKLRADLHDRAIVTYDPETGMIDLEVLGTPSPRAKADEARTALGAYWEFIQQAHLPYVERRFKIKLGAPNYRLLYYDMRAPGAPKVILQFVNGQYVMP